MTTFRIFLLTLKANHGRGTTSLAHRGRLPEAVLFGGTRCGCPGHPVSNRPGRSDNGPSGQYDPRGRRFALTRRRVRSGREKRSRREPEGNAACGKALADAEIATVERREASIRRSDAGRLISARVPVMARSRVLRGTRRLPALRPPLGRGRERRELEANSDNE